MNEDEETCCGSHSHLPVRNLRYGYHCSHKSSLSETICNQDVTQFFMGSPRTYKIKGYEISDLLHAKQMSLSEGKTFYVHAPYVATLASMKPDAYQSICDILDNIHDLPSSTVIHIGNCKNRTVNEAIQQIINNVNNLIVDKKIVGQFTSPKFKILLENSSGKKNDVGSNFDEIRKMFEGFDRCVAGICYDTQHAFSAGINKFETHEDACKVFEQCYMATGFYPQMIHLNDSLVEFGNGKDRHACLGDGYIWNRETESLDSLRKICQELQIDMIPETADPCKDHVFLDNVSEKYEGN